MLRGFGALFGDNRVEHGFNVSARACQLIVNIFRDEFEFD